MSKKEAVSNALKIGVACNLIYFINYIFRNLLSVFTPGMLETGFFEKDAAALYASIYMIVYALGQLFLGVTGDYVKPKYMVSAGLFTAGAGLMLFPLTSSKAAGIISFALLGFGLSALRGPLVKVISENMKPAHARLACVFLSVVSFLGPLIAGVLGALFFWRTAFLISAAVAALLGVFTLMTFGRFEKSGCIASVKERKSFSFKGALSVFRLESFVAYVFIGMIAETMASSVSFWIPTCFTEYLSFTPEVSGLLYSGVSAIKAVCPFLCLLLLKVFRENDMKLVAACYAVSMAAFFLMRFTAVPMAVPVLFLLALIPSSVTVAVIWSVYIPSLGKTGRSSSCNGIIDCSGYFAAAAANLLFASVMQKHGWSGVFSVWAAVSLLGLLIALAGLRQKKRSAENSERV